MAPQWLRLFQFVFLFLSLGVATTTFANSETTEPPPNHISIAAEDGWPPFADQYGRGISHQIIETVFERQNVEVRSVIVPYNRALLMAENGDVDAVFNVSRHKSASDKYLFGKHPLFITNSVIFENTKRPIAARTIKQLANKTRVGVIKGFEYDGQILNRNDLEFIVVDNQYQLINLLLVNRIDAAVMYEKVAESYIKQMGVATEISKAFVLHTGEIYIGFSKQRPYAQQLVQLFDQGLEEFLQEEIYHNLIAGYATAPQL